LSRDIFEKERKENENGEGNFQKRRKIQIIIGRRYCAGIVKRKRVKDMKREKTERGPTQCRPRSEFPPSGSPPDNGRISAEYPEDRIPIAKILNERRRRHHSLIPQTSRCGVHASSFSNYCIS
jgi:hypothetical protein